MSQEKKLKWDPVFDLNRDMLQSIGEEFDVSKPVSEFAARIAGVDRKQLDKIAKGIFGDYGTRWMKTTLELGEQYVERGYEILKEHCSRPDVSPFPFILQRFLEVAYLGVNQSLPEVGFLETTPANIEFWLDDSDCDMLAEERKKLSPDIVDTLPCKHACLSALKTLVESISVPDAEVMMLAEATKGGLCQFSIRRKHIVLPTLPMLRW